MNELTFVFVSNTGLPARTAHLRAVQVSGQHDDGVGEHVGGVGARKHAVTETGGDELGTRAKTHGNTQDEDRGD